MTSATASHRSTAVASKGSEARAAFTCRTPRSSRRTVLARLAIVAVAAARG